MIGTGDPYNAFLDYPAVEVAHQASGPLSGLTLAVKDIFDVTGYRSGWGNPARLAQAQPATATNSAIQSLLDAGARFIGKTLTEELAFSMIGQNVHFPYPVNPRAPDRVTGGSSSGSAAAVAGGLADIAIGSDTGGSIRCPASFCGLIGLRTTHAAIPLDHTMPLAPSFDTFGWFARDMGIYRKVAALLLSTLTPNPSPQGGGELGVSASETLSPLWAGVRGGGALARPLSLPMLDALVVPACADEYRRLRGVVTTTAGETETVPAPPFTLDQLYWTMRRLQAREAWDAHGAWIEAADRKMGKATFDRFAFGKSVTPSDVATDTANRNSFRVWLGELLGDDGYLILPTVTDIAPRTDATPEQFSVFREASIRLLCWSGLSGFPQLTLPLGEVDGAPFGISLLGPPGSDLALLEFGSQFLKVT